MADQDPTTEEARAAVRAAYYAPLIELWLTLMQNTVEEKLTYVNAKTVPGPDRLVTIEEIMAYLRGNNLWLPIKLAARTPLEGPGNMAAYAVSDLVTDMRVQQIDMALPAVQTTLAALVLAGLLLQEQAEALTALKNTNVAWWQKNGYSSAISLDDLAAAGLS